MSDIIYRIINKSFLLFEICDNNNNNLIFKINNPMKAYISNNKNKTFDIYACTEIKDNDFEKIKSLLYQKYIKIVSIEKVSTTKYFIENIFSTEYLCKQDYYIKYNNKNKVLEIKFKNCEYLNKW